mgnify:CR=1 FL=1
MTAVVMDGNALRDEIIVGLRERIEAAGSPAICLATVLVGDDGPSQRYVRMKHAKAAGVDGLIVVDLPPEEGRDYIKAMKKNNLSPIYIFSPETSDTRLAYLASFASGFVYCRARKGVTGKHTAFSDDLSVFRTSR